jgi:hypothetical protein
VTQSPDSQLREFHRIRLSVQTGLDPSKMTDTIFIKDADRVTRCVQQQLSLPLACETFFRNRVQVSLGIA